MKMKSENEFHYSWIAFGDICFCEADMVRSLPIWHFYNNYYIFQYINLYQ